MKKSIRFTALLCLIISFFGGCRSLTSPPTVQSIEEHFFENYDDINFITEYMTTSVYRSIYINAASGEMFVDGNTKIIPDEAVLNTIKRLFESGYGVITKDDNTICFQQWTRFMGAGCGIAYSINGSDLPQKQYLTELVPLSKDGWYYYVDDYEQWRKDNRGRS